MSERIVGSGVEQNKIIVISETISLYTMNVNRSSNSFSNFHNKHFFRQARAGSQNGEQLAFRDFAIMLMD